jgi:ADP-heptose:LPS heptosyltransferase
MQNSSIINPCALPKFLIIRLSSIGDIVLTTPVIRCLKRQVSSVEIHYLTKKEYATLITGNPYVDKVHSFEGNIVDTISKLKAENVDYIIDLHHNLRSQIIKFLLNKPSFSFYKLNFFKWLKVKFKIDLLPKVHIVDRYMNTIKAFGASNDNEGLDFFIAEKDVIKIDDLPRELHNGFIVLAAAAKHFTKQLPIPQMIELCDKIDKPVIILGAEEDFSKAELVCQRSKNFIYNACGKYSINQSASIIQYSNLIITPDTGLMHISAAYHKIILSVWGNTIPEFGMSPYFPHPDSRIFEIRDLPCRPCSKIGFPECPKGHFNCMNKQPINMIADYTNSHRKR